MNKLDQSKIKEKPRLSVVIPLSREETAWVGLCSDLSLLPYGTEIIFVVAKGLEPSRFQLESKDLPHLIIKLIESEPGRAKQMNQGALKAEGKWIWFLHADSRFTPKTIAALQNKIEDSPNALLFCDLKFLPGGPMLMVINMAGVWIRSHLFGLPFGDQGFCLEKDLFQRLGMYREDVPYGEDHLLVWRASRDNISLICTGGKLLTSSRKYEDNGWFSTTFSHLILTLRQGLPQFFMTNRLRLKKGTP